MTRRLVLIAVFLIALPATGAMVDVARACPLCSEANAANDPTLAVPRAYMYSILFMLAVPASILTGFGIGFYRLSKRQQALPDDHS